MKTAKKRIRIPKGCFDRHHLCWPRRDWNTDYCKALRDHWYFIAKIPRKTLHVRIHQAVLCVPTPTEASAKYVYEQVLLLEQYKALRRDDPIEKRLDLLATLFKSIDHHVAEAFEQQLRVVHKFYTPP